MEMQEQNAWLYDRYFSTMEKITETTLEVLTDRVFPHLTRDYTYWNVPSYKVDKMKLNYLKKKVEFFTCQTNYFFYRVSLHHFFYQ